MFVFHVSEQLRYIYGHERLAITAGEINWPKHSSVLLLYLVIIAAGSLSAIFFERLYWLFVTSGSQLGGGLIREEDLRAAIILGWLRLSCCDLILVEVVALEEFLYAVSSQLCFTFLDCFSIFPFLIINMICVEVILVDVGYEL